MAILIIYATRTGSTKKIAEFIGETLAKLGEEIEIKPIQSEIEFERYKAIVLGSAIQSGKLLPETTEFVKMNKVELSQKPFAVFLVCMTLAMKNSSKYHSFVSAWLEPIRIIVNPVIVGLFPGVLNISKIQKFSDRLKFRLSVLFGVWKEGDHRDWDEIQLWTKKLKSEIDKN